MPAEHGGVECQKPEPRKRAKARQSRAEASVIQRVRAACVERDGECRLAATLFGRECFGASEWAHMGEKRRYKTRGLPPEERHSTVWTCQLCSFHHTLYDDKGHPFDTIEITALDSVKGADGILRISRGSVSVLSVPRT